jgi:hypothetical protein
MRLANDALPLTRYGDTLKEFRKRVRGGAVSASTASSSGSSSGTLHGAVCKDEASCKRKRTDNSQLTDCNAVSGEHYKQHYINCM